MDRVITKEEWVEFKGHIGYKILTDMIKQTQRNLAEFLACGGTLGNDVAQATATTVGRNLAYQDVLDFNPVEEEENREDELRSNRFSSYS